MRLSSPSYVIPGTWFENIQYIDHNLPEISNVELLFFIYDDETKNLLKPEEAEILSYKGRLTFTLHLPDPVIQDHKELVEKFLPIVSKFVIHPPEKGNTEHFKNMINSWTREFGSIFMLENLIHRDNTWLLENTQWPLCLDTGHLLIKGKNPAEYFVKYKDRIEEIHIHGLSEGHDHRPLTPGSKWLEELLPLLEEFRGILNIELFNAQEVTDSIKVINNLTAL